MNTLIDTPVSATLTDGKVNVRLASGIELSFSCADYPRLSRATEAQRANMELSPMGIHWPDVDEDLSIRGLLRDSGMRQS